jgi:hypothetical protein
MQSRGELHLGSAEPRWVPIQVHFDMEYPLLFLKVVAKVSIHKNGGNQPLEAIKGGLHPYH